MRKFVLVLLLHLLSVPASALEWGKDYLEIAPQPTSVKHGQVEVLEFFWYRCPHCFHLEPDLHAWTQKLPRNVVFRRVPAILGDGWVPLARAFYALEAIGMQEKLHEKLFRAIHLDGLDLDPPGAFLDWAAKNGANRAKLAAAYDSFAVDAKVSRARQLSSDFEISGVPAFVVAGRYSTSASLAGGVPELFKVLDGLIEMERK